MEPYRCPRVYCLLHKRDGSFCVFFGKGTNFPQPLNQRDRFLILHRCNEGRDDKEDYKEVEL